MVTQKQSFWLQRKSIENEKNNNKSRYKFDYS